jgi:hypothetical protein
VSSQSNLPLFVRKKKHTGHPQPTLLDEVTKTEW